MRTDVLVGGIIGAVVGGVLGVLGCHVAESKKYMRQLETEVSKIRTSYEKKEKEKKAAEEKPVEEPNSEPVKAGNGGKSKESETKPTEEESNQYRDKVSIYEGALNKDKEEQVNYASYSTPPKEEKTVNKEKKKKKYDENDPYPISDVDYYDTFPEFDKVRCTWFSESHVLVQDDETILDVDGTVGFENISEWPDDGMAFVRNVARGVDYEISFVDGRYDYDLD